MKVWRKMGCLSALLLMTAVCCAGPLTTLMAGANGSTSAEGITGDTAGFSDRMLAAYKSAAILVTDSVPTCRGMRWQVLAGIAKIESNNATGHTITAAGDITPHIVGPRLDGSGAGGNTTAVRDTDGGKWDGDTVYDRAVGPFQFLPPTFRAYGKDANADGHVDPHNADDSALAAALYLCGTGRNLTDRGQLSTAIYGYNHSDAYVSDVLSWIDHYDALTGSTAPSGTGLTGTVGTVVQAALSQEGVPYSWGGGNATGKSRGVCCSPGGQDGRTVVGFDCSGLTLYAFAQAGVTLPRTAAAQAGIGTRIPASAGVGALQPGDLVFYGYLPTADSTIHHVGIYLGGGQMINAAKPGTTVRLDSVTSMVDYAGGARIL